MASKKEEGEKQKLNIEEVLTQIGEFGLFQKLVDAVFCVVFMFVGFQILIMYFTTLTPTWRCTENKTLSAPCLTIFGNEIQSAENKTRCALIPRNSWKYTEGNDFSLVTQFDICDEEWLLDLLQSIHFVGWGIGGITLGMAGDIFGRKNLLFPSCGFVLLAGFLGAFMENICVIIALRFIIGFFVPGAMVQGNILISEIVGNKKRPLAAMIPFFSFPIGYALLALKSYLLQNWKYLSIVCTAPYIFVLPFYFFIAKSPKWLLSRGRHDEAIKSLKKIARWNKTQLDENIELAQESAGKGSSSVSTPTAVWNREMIVRTSIQSFMWLVVTMSFFGLQMAAKKLKGSMYSNFALLSMIQFPAIIVTIWSCNKFGRKKPNIVSLACASVSCLAIVFIPERFVIARVVLGIVGKFFASLTFQGLYLWSAELFPTSMRSKTMGILQITARVGATAAPWVVKGLKGGSLPFVVLGVPAFVGAMLGLWLPETQVREQAEKSGEIGKVNEIEME